MLRTELVSDGLFGGARTSLNTWNFESSTSDKVHTTTLWSDGRISCTCKGWAILKPKTIIEFGQTRWCKHLTALKEEATMQYNQWRNQQGRVVNPAPVRDPRTGRVSFPGRPVGNSEPDDGWIAPSPTAVEATKPKSESKTPQKLNLRPGRSFEVS